jgi:hypothetical protein
MRRLGEVRVFPSALRLSIIIECSRSMPMKEVSTVPQLGHWLIFWELLA